MFVLIGILDKELTGDVRKKVQDKVQKAINARIRDENNDTSNNNGDSLNKVNKNEDCTMKKNGKSS